MSSNDHTTSAETVPLGDWGYTTKAIPQQFLPQEFTSQESFCVKSLALTPVLCKNIKN